MEASRLRRRPAPVVGGEGLGFGWEVGAEDAAAAARLRLRLDELGGGEERAELELSARLALLLVASERYEELTALAARAGTLGSRFGDPEALLLARLTRTAAWFVRGPDPVHGLELFDQLGDLIGLAEECERDELLFRALQLAAAGQYVNGRTAESDAARARAAAIAAELDDPRFAWEVDLGVGMRRLDRGDRAGAEEAIRRAGAAAAAVRPDLHIAVELVGLTIAEWVFAGEFANGRVAFEATQRAMPRGFAAAFVVLAAALDGDRDHARRELHRLLADELEPLRRPDAQVPTALWALAYAATELGDREAGARLLPLLEPQRGRISAAVPIVGFGHPGAWHLGRLELLAGQTERATGSLRSAAALADACGLDWVRGHVRVDLARALHLRGDRDAAAETLAAGEEIGARHGLGWTLRAATGARAELDGRAPERVLAGSPGLRRLRALAARGGRRALAAMVDGQSDAELERRFADPEKQRLLLGAMAQTFQPARANGFSGVVAYELRPHAIEPPAGAPWHWAMELDAASGEARVLDSPAPAPAATIRIGLAEWVRVIAGVEAALTAMVAGRCRVEGDVVLAARLEAMFGAD